jgi:hypothetical protein
MNRVTHETGRTALPRTPYELVSMVYFDRGWHIKDDIAVIDTQSGGIIDGMTFPNLEHLHRGAVVPQEERDRQRDIRQLTERYWVPPICIEKKV